MSLVRADVALSAVEENPDALVGSFTVDGLTYAVDGEGEVALVAIGNAALGADRVQSAEAAFANGEVAEDADVPVAADLALPSSVAFDGAEYLISRIAPLALAGAAISALSIPASVQSIDSAAALGCETLERIDVLDGNPCFSTFDGYLTDKAQTSILLVPEGRIGQLRIPSTITTIDPRVFSHCARIDGFIVDADCPGLASWNGSIYRADLTELIRVPAGAVELTLPAECAAIGASALSGCAELRAITALGEVTSIAPSAFGEIEEVRPFTVAGSLTEPAGSGVDASDANLGAGVSTPQVTGLVAVTRNALSSATVDKEAIVVNVPEGSDAAAWENAGFIVEATEAGTSTDAADAPLAEVQSAAVERATSYWTVAPNYPERGYVTVTSTNISGVVTGTKLQSRPIMTGAGSVVIKGESNRNWSWTNGNQYAYGFVAAYPGYTYKGWSTSQTGTPQATFARTYEGGTVNQWAIFDPNPYTIALNGNGSGAVVESPSIPTTYDAETQLPVPTRSGYLFEGWDTKADGSGSRYSGTASKLTTTSGATVTLYAQWKADDFDVSFDTDSEPGDEDYSGNKKPDETVNVEDGIVAIENPTRPGYVFQGWVIPNAGGTEAIDQELVYEGDDGKWYVDASKLPDYAGDDGKVELTARWTSVISVDVPNSVTFYADTVTQGSESRDGLADRAFGQSKVQSQSQVALRIVGLESQEVEGDGATSLGASDVLVSKGASTPADSAWKLFSLYPSATELTPEALQDPDRVSATPEGGVTFGLDDVLLEKSFSADDFTIPAGDTLSLGYRLNLEETGTSLDYGKLSALPEGGSAALANISYCFAADYGPVFWTVDDDGSTLDLAAIKADAEAIAAGDSATAAKYSRWMGADHRFYVKWFDQGVSEADDPTAATIYDVRIVGIGHDDKSDGSGKAGITFQFVNLLQQALRVNPSDLTTGGWGRCELRANMNPGIQAGSLGEDADAVWDAVPLMMRPAIVEVRKAYGPTATGTAATVSYSDDRLFLASYVELTGAHPSSMIGYAWIGKEGSQYAYWKGKVGNPTGANNALRKGSQAAPTSYLYWWERSVSPWSDRHFMATLVNGIPSGQAHTAGTGSICPMFCL